MRKRFASLVLTATVINCLALGGAAMAHETGPCQGHAYGNHKLNIWPADSLGIISVAGLAYVDDRNMVDGNGVWIYLETNGEGGLQRGGMSPSGIADPCQESSNPDTLVF